MKVNIGVTAWLITTTVILFRYVSADVDTNQEPLIPEAIESFQQPKDEIPRDVPHQEPQPTVVPVTIPHQASERVQPINQGPSGPGQNSQCSGGFRTPVYIGMPGLIGPPGPQGWPGVQGPTGPSGNHGNNGINGQTGLDGSKGQKGTKGEPGFPGVPGAPGVEGRQGHRGNIGNPGDDGYPGSQGPVGKTGLSGGPGTPGRPGAPGLEGLKGDIGDVGTKGEKGDCACPHESSTRRKASFSVARSSGLIAENGPVIIKWDTVFSNVGGNFDSETGIFNCTITGSYYFVFHLYKSSNQNYPLVQLMKNDEHTVGAIDYGPMDSEDSTSNSVVLDLQAADLVWLQLVEGRELYSSRYKFTTFSGFLLFEN